MRAWAHKLVVTLSALALLVAASLPAHAAPLIRDAEIEHTLRLYADPILKAAGLKPETVNIYIVRDDSLNAFVAGGANMFIHTGLIMAADTPDMLLGVMAHETGHIAGGHLARGGEKLKDAQLGTIMSVVLGAAAAAATGKPEAAAAVMSGGQNAMLRSFLSYTRTQEQAADQAALNILDRLSISAEGLLKTFRLLQRNERMRGGKPDPYMLSHPLSAERMDHVRAHIEASSIPPGRYPAEFTLPHQRMQAKLYAFFETPEKTLQKYPTRETSLPARMARAVAYYKMADTQRAVNEIELMQREAKNDAFLYDLKGQILFENNQPQAAREAYVQASRLMPRSALILTDLAKTELAGDAALLPSAIAHLEKATAIDSDNPQSWRLLATAHGRRGNQALASLALAEEALLLDKPQDATRHATQAKAALKAGSASALRADDVLNRAEQLRKEKEEADSPL